MAIQDTDTFLLNNAGASYRITASDLKSKLAGPDRLANYGNAGRQSSL